MNKRTLLLCGAAFFLSLQNAHSTTYADLKTAFAKGGTLELDSDVDLETRLLYLGNDLLIEGNGYAINGLGEFGSLGTTNSSGTEHNLSVNNVTFENMSGNNGSAINSYGFIGYIKNSKFINNQSTAIYIQHENDEVPTLIENTLFENNSLNVNGSGGAIFQANSGGKLNIIKSRFIGNHGSSGGAIVAEGHIDRIYNSEFIGNSATNSGGAIILKSRNKELSYTKFEDNHVLSPNANAQGGAALIYNSDNVSNVNFTGNYAKSVQGSAIAGAAAITGNSELISDVTFKDNFAEGKSQAQSGAFNVGGRSAIKSLQNIMFDNNRTIAENKNSVGGAMTLLGKIEKMENIQFVNNYAYSKDGTAGGGALANGSTYASVLTNGLFENNYAKSETNSASGGALLNDGKFGDIINSRFINNYVQGNEESAGGAIFSTTDLSLVSDNGLTEFSGNKANKESNAIFMADAAATLSLTSKNNGIMLFDDAIDGTEGYGLKIDGEASSVMAINNKISNANIELNTFDMAFENAACLNHNNSLNIKSGSISITNLGSDKLKFRDLALNGGDIKIGSVDVDLSNREMGRIIADTASSESGKLIVNQLNLISDAQTETTAVLFAQEGIANAVSSDIKEASTAVYVYAVRYEPKTGEFIFTRNGFMPIVFARSASMKASANTQEEVATKIIEAPRVIDYSKARIWATPYYSDDTIGYSGFYDVDSRNYGLIAGVDSKAYALGKNWTSVYTAFGAYNDGEDKYQGVKVDSKSWLVGLKASVYNGGFYGDAIVNYAWHDSDQKTAFGTDSVDSTGYGAALKAGYKHGFDKVELDTSAMLSWQTIEGGSFTSKSGARISTDDYRRLTLIPQIKLSYKMDQVKPYALVRYNFVLDQEGSSTVNNIALPEIESKDYIEYGLGLETTDAFPHSGYAHVLRHDGGREGWSVTAGYKYNF